MPIYEYRCDACGHLLEALQKFSDEPLKECPECHKDALLKLMSAGGFQLKGTGWYATDFRHKGKSEAKTTTETKEITSGSDKSDSKESGDKSSSTSSTPSTTEKENPT